MRKIIEDNAMSGIAQIFESGEHKSRQGHFRNLVMLARADGKIDPEEQLLLNRMARRLSLTDAQVKEIIEHEDQYPTIPPFSLEDRYERFVRFTQMVMSNGTVSQAEKSMAIKFGVALGLDEKKVEPCFNAILEMWLNGMDATEIVEELI